MKGSSRHWSETLQLMTGSDKLDPQAMLDYFQPLYEWLSKQNLPDVDWDCDSYLTDNGRVKSYSRRAREMASSSSSFYGILRFVSYLQTCIFSLFVAFLM